MLGLGATRVPRHANQLQRRPSCPQGLGQFDTAHVRHAQIRQQQIDCVTVLIEDLQGFLPVPGLVHPVTGTREGGGKQLPDGGLVLDQEDRLASLPMPARQADRRRSRERDRAG